ncbi:MAG: YqgE/AlgH family protein [Planctomycetota bacterium]
MATPTFNGRLLIASPHLTDGNFFRSVVLMVQHDDEGGFGLLLNRPTDRRLRGVLVDAKDDAAWRDDDLIYCGGPVEGPLLAIHTIAGIGRPCGGSGDAANVEISDSPAHAFGEMSFSFDPAPIWVTSDEDHLRILARRHDAPVRYVAAYSGWGPKQLEYEFEQGGWLVGDADPDLVFGDSEELWESVVKRCGHEILGSVDPKMKFGDPNLN